MTIQEQVDQMSEEEVEARFEELRVMLNLVNVKPADPEHPPEAVPIELLDEFDLIKKRLGYS